MLPRNHWSQPRKEQGCDKGQLGRTARVQEIAIAQDKIFVSFFRCEARGTEIRGAGTELPFPPQVGDTVLALHRKDRSDLFFDGEVVTKKPDNNKVVLSFSLGRAKGQKCTIDLEDLHQISRKKLGVEELLKLCKRRQPLQVDQSRVPLELHAGNFVVIDGPKNQTWVAQLMESFVGKISNEVGFLDNTYS
jgi:hypothetical protein